MDNFNTRKWFKNQYLKEANLNEDSPIQTKEEAFKILRDIQEKLYQPSLIKSLSLEADWIGEALDFLQAEEVSSMMAKEKENKY